MNRFRVVSDYQPAGSQPEAIRQLVEGVNGGERFQTLLGITGSGKSATIAWAIEALERPTLVIAPNKSLAAQLANEFRGFFPDNRVEYFVSYYDYYQPEAYIPSTDTFIEKDSSVNDEIDRLRHSATSALLTRRDVVVVASVSAIYGLGSPKEYEGQIQTLVKGNKEPLSQVVRQLVAMRYERNDLEITRGHFRVKGDTLEIHPAYEELPLRVELFGDEIERISRIDLMTGEIVRELEEFVVFPATHYLANEDRIKVAIAGIEAELGTQLAEFERRGKLLEAQRLRMRTEFDLEMLGEMGFCSGIENYSRYLDGRVAGETPYTLLDYFPKDFLTIVDESHVTVSQLRGQYAGDRSRKETLVEYGFRLPSALDNRPLRFDEFFEKVGATVFMSATPGPFEREHSGRIVEQVVRPTGLLDPIVEVRPSMGQMDDLLREIRVRVERSERVLVTTLTKRMAEDLTDYFAELGVKVRYLHSNVETLDRIALIRDLRLGEYDVLVGINLLREGLDLPEVSLVAILDADKEGFLRSETSLVQTIGRAARNENGTVIMYADAVTRSMSYAISETTRRREVQRDYNRTHGVTPRTVHAQLGTLLGEAERGRVPSLKESRVTQRYGHLSVGQIDEVIGSLVIEMERCATELKYEEAAALRDQIRELERLRERADA